MNPCGDATMSAKYLHRFDNELWAEIDPIEKKRNLKFDTPSRIKKKIEAKPKKKKEKEEEKEGKKIRIRNTQFSFTSFLIPLCVTGERKDYQFLYCICALRNALKILSTTLRKEGFAQLYMVGMKSAVDWEKIKANRTTFSDIITEFLIKSGSVCMVAANRKELYTKVNNPDAPFIVLLAATDIQLPSREKLCVGTSWLIFRRTEQSRNVLFDREVFHCGRRAINAGVLVNGCSTMMTTGFKRIGGIHHFIFDNRYGDFILLQEKCFLRSSGTAIFMNEALFYKFPKEVQSWVLEKKLGENEYYSRYTGGWLSDGYRILRSGGLLLSPQDSERTEGRIKYLSKALPMAFLIEKAGGKATDGRIAITKLGAKKSPFTKLVFGTVSDVDAFMEVIKESSISDQDFMSSGTDTDDTSTDFE